MVCFGQYYVLFTLFGYWVRGGGGLPTDWYFLLQLFTPGSSKVSETYFFLHIMTTQNDRPIYVSQMCVT